MKLYQKIALGTTATIFYGLSIYLPWRIGTWNVEDRMQLRQETIIEQMNQNPLTRISDGEQFMKIYRETEKFYDKYLNYKLTREDLNKLQKIREKQYKN